MKRRIIPRTLSNNKDLIQRLDHVNRLSSELHKITTHEAIGELLGVSRQAVAYQSKKEAVHEK